VRAGATTSLTTRAFLTLLPLTERLGRVMPGEIMEMVAYRPEEGVE
jgi:hypothetical protein